MEEFSARLKQFIADSAWIFAKTYATTWPHEYIVQERVDNDLFLELTGHIDRHGYESEFYSTRQIYFDFEGNTYWHMGSFSSPPARGGVATSRGRGSGSRCPESETYRRRKAEGLLPTASHKSK